jgi:hypothetical protein
MHLTTSNTKKSVVFMRYDGIESSRDLLDDHVV